MKKRMKLLMAGLLSITLISCEDKEEVDLFAAQQCLDTATTATAQTCVAKIAGNKSAQAYILRCAADFIGGGITTASIATALEGIDKAGTDPTSTIVANFKFSDTAAADAAAVNCNATGSKTLIALVNTARLATVLTVATGCINSTDPTTINNYIDTYTPGTCTGAAAEGLATVLIDSQNSMCGTDGPYKDNDICTNLNASISANPGNNQALIDQFLNTAK